MVNSLKNYDFLQWCLVSWMKLEIFNFLVRTLFNSIGLVSDGGKTPIAGNLDDDSILVGASVSEFLDAVPTDLIGVSSVDDLGIFDGSFAVTLVGRLFSHI
jgi:hypothetical protein